MMRKIIALLCFALSACGGGYAEASGVSSVSNYNPSAVAITGGTITTTKINGWGTSSAAPGEIGEIITGQRAFGSFIALTSATSANITTLTLTPGQWIVTANCAFLGAATTSFTHTVINITDTLGLIFSTHPTLSGRQEFFGAIVPTNTYVFYTHPLTENLMITGSTSDVLTLVCSAYFTVSTATGGGWIEGRRVR